MKESINWIDVNESIPESKGEYLIHDKEDGICKADLSSITKKGIKWFLPYYGQDCAWEFRLVTHWAEIPSKPVQKA